MKVMIIINTCAFCSRITSQVWQRITRQNHPNQYTSFHHIHIHNEIFLSSNTISSCMQDFSFNLSCHHETVPVLHKFLSMGSRIGERGVCLEGLVGGHEQDGLFLLCLSLCMQLGLLLVKHAPHTDVTAMLMTVVTVL